MSAQAPIREMIGDPTIRQQTTYNPQRIELRVGGMKCDHCPPTIEKALAAVPGVSAAHVNAATKIVRIEFDSGRVKISDLLKVIRSIGYAPGTATTRLPIKNMHCSSCV